MQLKGVAFSIARDQQEMRQKSCKSGISLRLMKMCLEDERRKQPADE